MQKRGMLIITLHANMGMAKTLKSIIQEETCFIKKEEVVISSRVSI
ncbi:hypothetical protein [Thermococcus piezophilus]|nr:hypothetical protein [Thermococcus piezophilus]